MIKQRYPSIRPKPVYFPQHNPPKKQYEPPVDIHVALTEERAKKAGLSVEEYRKRVAIVATESKSCHWKPGDTGMPFHEKDREQYGKCVVVGVVRHYDDWGTAEWNEKFPYLLTVAPLNDRNSHINCTHAWLVKEREVAQVPSDEC